MRILVTGASGQLARCLSEAVVGRPEFDLATVGRPDLDLEQPESIGPVLTRVGPELVINAAAYTAVDRAEDEPERVFAINADAAGLIARASASRGVPVVQLSTDYVFDGRKRAPYVEDDPTAPLNVYGRSKLDAEERVRAETHAHVIVRTSWVYSPFGHNFVRTMLELARTRDKVRVVADQFGCPTSALDLAESLLVIASRIGKDAEGVLGRTFHVSGTGSCSWADFAEHIFAVSKGSGGPSARVERISTAEFPTKAERPARSVLDCGRFDRAFDWRMPDWRDSAADVVRRRLA